MVFFWGVSIKTNTQWICFFSLKMDEMDSRSGLVLEASRPVSPLVKHRLRFQRAKKRLGMKKPVDGHRLYMVI
jgi:hypothetical protein